MARVELRSVSVNCLIRADIFPVSANRSGFMEKRRLSDVFGGSLNVREGKKIFRQSQKGLVVHDAA